MPLAVIEIERHDV